MNQNIINEFQNLKVEEINKAITKTQKIINNLQDELCTLKVIKIKKEMGINYLTIREQQRQYQRQYYLKRKQGKEQKVYNLIKPNKTVSQIIEGKIILEI